VEGSYCSSLGVRGELLYTKYTLTCVQDLVEGSYLNSLRGGGGWITVHQVHCDLCSGPGGGELPELPARRRGAGGGPVSPSS
jgi:hypothetical protein